MKITPLEFAQMRERIEAARRRGKPSQEFDDNGILYTPKRVKQSMKNNSLREVPEREIQDDIAQYLRLNGIYFVRSRMDKRTTVELGVPDFIVCCPANYVWTSRRNVNASDSKFVALEVKRPGQLPTAEQIDHAQRIQASGGKWACVHSLDEAIKALVTL